ncbi:hypothetical protein RJ639_012871 [Escallonia herrerae]|uniref:Luc7-like protein 3 n=1 Tax=Escallonia herrerae TaxID=1293975 RepID=A0AA89APZ8_9ASTE|nr:hypothetical protein RJ639_012871 [Escallonia herrerae]
MNQLLKTQSRFLIIDTISYQNELGWKKIFLAMVIDYATIYDYKDFVPFHSFENSPRHDSYVPKFEEELARFCEKLVMDLDRKVRRGRERLAQEVEVPPSSPVPAEKSEQLSILEEKIKNLLEQVEALGEAGKVDEAEALMRKVDMLNAEKTLLTLQPQNAQVSMLAQEKKMALCEICGSFLVANDAVERTQSHVTGKQHIGFGLIRDFLSEHKEAKEKAREEQMLAREKEAEERRKLREKENESRRRRSDSADRDRVRDRDQDRDRDRDRDRYHGQDRDREMSRDRNGRGSRDVGRGSDRKYSNFRNGSRDRYRERDRSRSRSPVRHGQKSFVVTNLPVTNITKGERVELCKKQERFPTGEPWRVVSGNTKRFLNDTANEMDSNQFNNYELGTCSRRLKSLRAFSGTSTSLKAATSKAALPTVDMSPLPLSSMVEMYCNITSSSASISSSASEPPVKLMHLSTAASRSTMTCAMDSSILRTVSLNSIPWAPMPRVTAPLRSIRAISAERVTLSNCPYLKMLTSKSRPLTLIQSS